MLLLFSELTFPPSTILTFPLNRNSWPQEMWRSGNHRPSSKQLPKTLYKNGYSLSRREFCSRAKRLLLTLISALILNGCESPYINSEQLLMSAMDVLLSETGLGLESTVWGMWGKPEYDFRVSAKPSVHLKFTLGCWSLCPLHTVLTPTRKSYRDSCWQFGYQALTGLGWLKNHVKVMDEREILNKSYKFSWYIV